VNSKEILSSEGSPPPALAKALHSQYGNDWLEWDPITIWAEVKDDFGIDLSEEHKNAIMALRTCMGVVAPWKEWYPFVRVVDALNGDLASIEYVAPPSIADLAYAVDLMTRLKPDIQFSDEVRRMMAITLWDHGVCWAPVNGLGRFVNDYLLEYQKTPEQRLFLSFLAKDYLADDGYDAMDDYDAVRMHTIKLKSMDIYVTMKRKAEEV